MGIMNIFAFQILGAAILMMLYACAVPLSEERRGGRGYEMLRGVGNMMQNGPGDEEERDCPCLDCWDPCIHFGVEEERGGLNKEMQNGGEEPKCKEEQKLKCKEEEETKYKEEKAAGEKEDMPCKEGEEEKE